MQQRELATNSKQQKPNKPEKYCQATSPATRKPAIVRGVGGSGETLRCLEMVVHIICDKFIEFQTLRDCLQSAASLNSLFYAEVPSTSQEQYKSFMFLKYEDLKVCFFGNECPKHVVFVFDFEMCISDVLKLWDFDTLKVCSCAILKV